MKIFGMQFGASRPDVAAVWLANNAGLLGRQPLKLAKGKGVRHEAWPEWMREHILDARVQALPSHLQARKPTQRDWEQAGEERRLDLQTEDIARVFVDTRSETPKQYFVRYLCDGGAGPFYLDNSDVNIAHKAGALPGIGNFVEGIVGTYEASCGLFDALFTGKTHGVGRVLNGLFLGAKAVLSGSAWLIALTGGLTNGMLAPALAGVYILVDSCVIRPALNKKNKADIAWNAEHSGVLVKQIAG